MAKSTTIEALATAVFDNGRRGMPRPGCDCEQCFGYCLVDRDEAYRKSVIGGAFTQNLKSAPLKFD